MTATAGTAPPSGRSHRSGGERRADLGIEARSARRAPGAWSAPSPNRSTAASSSARDLGEAERAVEEPGDGDLVGGDERGRRALADAARLAGDPAAPGSGPRRAPGSRAGRPRRDRPRPTATGGGRDRSGRTGSEVACRGCPAGPSGSRPRSGRLSGRRSAGGSPPRSRRTSTSYSQCASTTSRPLFASVAESIVIFAPIDHVGWRRACSRGHRRRGPRGPSRNGPPDAVRTSAATPAIRSPTRHCQIAECSESIGRSQASGLANGSRGVRRPRRPRRVPGRAA